MRIRNKRILAMLSLAIGIILLLWIGGCSNGRNDSDSGKTGSDTAVVDTNEPVTKQSFYFDTIVQITVYDIEADDQGDQSDSDEQNNQSIQSDQSRQKNQGALSDYDNQEDQGTPSDRGGQQIPGTPEDDSGQTDQHTQSGQTISTDRKEKIDQVINEAFRLCASYENLFSRTKEGTDIWNINHAGGAAVKVDSETLALIQKGIDYGRLSDGRFDITIGPAEDLWDFHSDDPHVPDEAALAQAIRHVDYTKIRIDAQAQTVQLEDAAMEIDLGGIAKGYIADKVCELLREEGVTSAIISLGGNIETIGGKPIENTADNTITNSANAARTANTASPANTATDTDSSDASQEPFTIGIETPYSERTQITGSVKVTDGTVVTSGVYERHFTVNGKDYHHILDVQTGYPVDTDVLGVTIVGAAGHSVDCDALSTICLILGSSEGKALIESMDGYEAAFILQDDTVVTTSGMQMQTEP